MPKDYKKEISFQAGELSPRFYGRSETEFYQKGLEIAKNVTIDKRGGAFRRGGLRNRETFGDTFVKDKARVFTKQIHPYRFDTITLDNSGFRISAPEWRYQSANLLSNPKFDVNGGSWSNNATGESQVSYNERVAKMRPAPGDTFYISQNVTVTAGTGDTHSVEVQQATSRPIRINVGIFGGGDDIAGLSTKDEYARLDFVPNSANYFVSIVVDGDETDEADIVFVGTIATADLPTYQATFDAGPWGADQLDDVILVESPDGTDLYFLHPNEAPQKIVYDFATDAYTAVAAVTFTAAPAAWTGSNYPSTGTFFNGRFWLSGTPNEPQTVWASKSAAYENFTTGAGAADSWNFTISKQGRIEWLYGNKTLIVGTENGEHIVSSQSGVLSQDDFNVDQQSSYGSNKVQAIQVGEKIFYCTGDGRRIQSMGYAWQEDNWLSQDLTFASEHITESGAKHIAWAQNPDSLLLLTLEDGTAAVLTYDRTSETVAWTDFQYEDQKVLDIAVGSVAGKSRLVMVSQRTWDELELEIETSDPVYLDSYSQVYYETASDALSGLDHLEGEEVQVLVDGAVSVPQTVSGGAITAVTTGTSIIAGKSIESVIKTLPPDVPQDQIRSWEKRWVKVWALMHQSVAPIINGTRPPERSPSTPMDSPEPVQNRSYKVVTLGWDENGQVTVQENLPVPMNLLAIYGELARETL